MKLIVELERNPKRRFLSFLTGFACNFCLLGILCVVRFEAPDVFTGRHLMNAVVIAPQPVLAPAKLPRAPRVASPSPLVWAPPVQAHQPTLLALPDPAGVAPASLPSAASPLEMPAVAYMAPPRAPVVPPRTGLFVSAETTSPAVRSSAGPAMQVDSFGASTAGSASFRANGGVESADFGTAAVGSHSGRTPGLQTAGSSGFDTPKVVLSRPRERIPTQTGAFRSAEILSKPKPDYTEEARSKRVEGEVWLEVLFGADGTPHVRQVLRSLGYGLDENAIRAARLIRFRPAREGTREVDQVATVRVQFQLAE